LVADIRRRQRNTIKLEESTVEEQRPERGSTHSRAIELLAMLEHSIQSPDPMNKELLHLLANDHGILSLQEAFPNGTREDLQGMFDTTKTSTEASMPPENISLLSPTAAGEHPTMEVNTMEKILEESFATLSLQEKEKILFDVHGLPLIDQEDPANIDDLLDEIECSLHKIRRKRSYDKAKSILDGRLVKDRSLRLMFLRCDRFLTKVAAQRIVRHFDVKEDLFGDGEVLGRDVSQSDLSEEDMAVLESGFFQILPSRDSCGRTILFAVPELRPFNASSKSCVRTIDSVHDFLYDIDE